MAAPAEPATSPLSPTRTGQTVLARLHGLFENNGIPTATTSASAATHPRPMNGTSAPAVPAIVHPPAKFLKIRILTWNMHDSVPKGDLEELLGSVALSTTTQELQPGSDPFLALSADGNHPFHLVVVAGQECPSLSGIPMGLGAGFKLMDREKDRDRDKDRDKAKERDRDYDRPSSKLSAKDEDTPHDNSASMGWTSLIENWLCYGTSTCSPSPDPGKARNSSPAAPHTPTTTTESGTKEKRRGPYQLLVKDRMMGIYLAIYINRDIRDLVRGTSRSAVTAGLIGGRVGNKGGVGISINLHGTTLLFLNAHLAAHEGKIHHRLQNLAKIKSELTVDDFLSPDDPRVMAEDLTDKFDFTFLCGDLNFRLDISRLHADWLIDRKEYAQALEFDQLRNLMRNGQAFVGFEEAPINFPPTFKYDVLRTIKRAKRRSSRMAHWRNSGEKARLTEVEEKELEDQDDEDVDEEGGEAASMSSVWTSVHSRPGTDVDPDDDDCPPPASPIPILINRASIATAALKAKSKWLSLLSPASSPSSPHRIPRQHKQGRHTPPSSVDINNVDQSLPRLSVSELTVPRSPMEPRLSSRPSLVSRVSSAKTNISDEEEEDDDKGVYDSSHKRRVPSWCDRVLWKSTLEPDPYPDEEDEVESADHSTRTRTKVGQFFANAFRPLSARVRRESYSSTSTASVDIPSARPSSPEALDQVVPFSRFTSSLHPNPNAKPNLSSKSTEHLPPKLTISSPTTTPENNLRSRRSFSALPPLPPLAPIILPNMEPPTRSSTSRARNRSASAAADPSHTLDSGATSRDATPSRWRFFPFLSRGDSFSHDHHRSSTAESIAPPPHRKGDVVCLDYSTLDDRGMRRLEARSDHRPVIFQALAYI